MLVIENLFVKKEDFELKVDKLSIGENEYFVLLGKTGSGKTMLLETIAGFNRVKGGEIYFKGEKITNLAPEKRGFGFVYQDFALFPNLKVKENILFSVRYRKTKKFKDIFDEIVEFLQLESLLNRDVQHLSGGEKQRVAIARALMSKPKMLLLDEPLSAIDPSFRYEIMEYLKKIVPKYGISVIHVTHNFREAAYLADKMAVILDGRIVEYGDAHEILNRPKYLETAKFLGFKNILPSSLIDKRMKGYFTVDPTQIVLGKNPEKEISIKCVVDEVVPFIDHKKIYLSYGRSKLFVKVNGDLMNSNIAEGDEVFINFERKDISFLKERNEIED
ncbi:ATP-binding cassette domain-containing protein [Deferribacter autotrophicus]|uniref:ATP-binding cassette domain-containing protein n=1 Tax=Deferribacter autotrophicus TaxID=500465 RepID=A0A5A8F7R1_9BACT|nr:ATP-binding cassette domain-containing protein [Deferribacter autotrophicus]